MPSKKEGFGIVFIEAMYYGKPVIAGNKDGSVGRFVKWPFGLLIDPDDQEEITSAIIKVHQ
jgi:glycosyltransferase involved in cell wall biosynthesis